MRRKKRRFVSSFSAGGSTDFTGRFRTGAGSVDFLLVNLDAGAWAAEANAAVQFARTADPGVVVVNKCLRA